MKIREYPDAAGFVLRHAFVSFLRNRGMERAAVLSYNTFFALFPLMLLVLFVAGRFMAGSRETMEAVERVAVQLLPMFSDVVIREVEGLATQKAWGVASILLLLWAVTPLASAIRGSFDVIYKRVRPLPFFKEKLLDGLAVLLMLVLVLLSVAGEIVYAVVASQVAGHMPAMMRVTDWVGPLAMMVVFLAIIHWVFAPVRPRWAAVFAGGVVTAILLSIMGPVFTAIMRFNPDYGLAFGSLKAVFLLLIWVYYAFVAILLGLEVSAAVHWRETLLVQGLFTKPEKRHQYAGRLNRMAQGLEVGDLVFGEGEPGDSMFYVLSGAVTLTRGGEELRVMRAGEYFGELAMLLGSSRTATAVVSEPDTRLVTISAENMEAVLRQNPGIVLSLARELAERLRLTDERLGK
jgi:membrane protein